MMKILILAALGGGAWVAWKSSRDDVRRYRRIRDM